MLRRRRRNGRALVSSFRAVARGRRATSAADFGCRPALAWELPRERAWLITKVYAGDSAEHRLIPQGAPDADSAIAALKYGEPCVVVLPHRSSRSRNDGRPGTDAIASAGISLVPQDLVVASLDSRGGTR